MGKLLQRLGDASNSGVYRAPRSDEILDAAQGSTLKVARIDLKGVSEKEALMQHIALALEFPQWFGGNWDALEDCLSDLSWSAAIGHVLLIEHADALAADERGILVDILASAAASWAARGRSFFAVFVDGVHLPPAHLPYLYRNRK